MDDSKASTIARIEATSEKLTSRAGLSFFVRYVSSTGIGALLKTWFAGVQKTAKGQSVEEIFKQLFAFLVDGTSRHLVYFDQLQQDPAYAATIESPRSRLVSSHAVKRFFRKLTRPWVASFRCVLRELFVWRLRIENPEVVVLALDSMVMDNDEARVREGVAPTYKKVRGFQPLQLIWNRRVVDAIFRSGDTHCNEGSAAKQMVELAVWAIRCRYDETVPIVVRLDSGFLDQALFECFEELEIGYVCGGRLLADIQEHLAEYPEEQLGTYAKGSQLWRYREFGDRRGCWETFRRAIFCCPEYEDRQRLLEFARPDTILYTNLGMKGPIDAALEEAGRGKWLTPEGIIECYHGRGTDELAHRGLKDFGAETLPFKRFDQNASYYYTMLIAFSLFEAFKEDVVEPTVQITAYATTLRRRLIDLAGKFVRTARQTVLKIGQTAWSQLHLPDLWERANHPPPLPAPL